MSVSVTREFRDSLSELDTDSTVVAPSDLESTLRSLLERPAVGTPLQFDAASIDALDVTTDPSPDELRAAVTGITPARAGVSSLGTVAVESSDRGEELVALFPETHVAVLGASDIEPTLEAAFEWLGSQFEAGSRSFVFATGPSATGDMGALVQGVHGPSNVHVVVVDDE